MNFESKIYLARLYDIYYELLTQRQQKIFELFVEEDYSLSEISSYLNISLPAVSKSIKTIEKKLLEFESKLQILNTYQQNIYLLKKYSIKQEIIDQIK